MKTLRRSKAVNDTALKLLLKEYENGTAPTPDGSIQILTDDYNHILEIIPDAYDFPSDFTRSQAVSLLRRALIETRKSGSLTSERLLASAQQFAASELSRKPRRYVMWTKFRAKQMASSKQFAMQIGGVKLRTAKQLPKFMRIEEYFLSGFGQIDPKPPAFFGYIILSCEAKDAVAAANQMLEAYDLFMAMFNMYHLYGRSGRIYGRYWTEARLVLGPYQFLFEGKNLLSDEQIWWNPDFHAKAWDTFPLDMKDVLKGVPTVRRAYAKLSAHPMRKIIIRCLMLMQSAMSARDTNMRLLRLWSALEHLYGDGNDGPKDYKRIIQRASFPEANRELEKWKLTHASKLRNEFVHSGGENDELEEACLHLRLLLSRHISYLLFHADYIRSHQDFLKMVELPASRQELAHLKALIEAREKVIREPSSKD
jgi:hypothetical protein